MDERYLRNHGELLTSLSQDMTNWLSEKALPIWFSAGTDQDSGECFEAIDPATKQPTGAHRRARVVPRQIYSFVEGGKLGWTGPAKETASGLFDWYLKSYLTPEGYFAASVDRENRIVDQKFDLYNQAFALFGCAQIASGLPERRDEAAERAGSLLDFLRKYYRHPQFGFQEANPDTTPLCSNPHMHLFEACLTWEAIADDTVWKDLADEIAELTLNKFVDPVSGGLREFFDLDWTPMPGDKGRVMEPGHQFEWAWLLAKWGQSRSDAGALGAARRLYEIGRTYGICDTRGVAFMSLNDDFTVRDPIARLWGQTEWIKAAIALAEISVAAEQEAYLADIPEAVKALQVFLQDVPPGLWRDKLSPDGSFATEPAPASSLYHIVCAISELDHFVKAF